MKYIWERLPINRARQLITLQAGRGIAAVMVVVHHVAMFTGIVEFAAGHLGVEFFFVLSGIVILLAHFNDIDHPGTLRQFLWKRFRRVYPAYWVVMLPQLVFILARPRSSSLYQRDPWVVLSNLVLFHVHSTGVTVTVAWTLFHEILFYGFFALLLLNRTAGRILMTLWLASSLFFVHSQNTYWGVFFSPLHLIFAFGMIAAWLIHRGPMKQPHAFVIAGLALFVRACYVSNSLSTVGDANNILAGLGAMLAILGVVEFERRGRLTVWPSLRFLGDASYSIYLVHYPFIYAVTPGALRWWLAHHLPLALWMVSITFLSVGLGVLFHLFIERPLLRWMSDPRRPAIPHTESRAV